MVTGIVKKSVLILATATLTAGLIFWVVTAAPKASASNLNAPMAGALVCKDLECIHHSIET